MSWWMFALLAAIVQGIHYPLVDKALDHLSSYSVLALTVLPLVALYPFFHHQVVDDFVVFQSLTLATQLQILLLSVTSTIAAFLVYAAITASNATLASIIEVMYPIFVVFFAYIILQENHFSASVAVGGLLILVGACVIILGSN